MENFACDCGYVSPRWFGRCPTCGSWNKAQGRAAHGAAPAPEVVGLAPIGTDGERIPTGSSEVDRVLGGGITPGSTILLAGDPGVGKSTLALQVLGSIARTGVATLLIAGEESIAQVRHRATRLETAASRAAATTSVTAAIAAARSEGARVIVVDSIQTLRDERLAHGPGSVTQVRECAAALAEHARATGAAVILIGHVTKDGSIAGPKVLEHAVDVVLMLEGERTEGLRFLRCVKNRFGAATETGVLALDAQGLHDVPDASAIFLQDRVRGMSGSTVYAGLHGSRALLVEIQALVARTRAPARRVSIGIPARRMALLMGVLGKRARLALDDADVFVAVVGGVAVNEPAADLAVCTAIASSLRDTMVDPRVIAVGEVGLAGEIRRVPGVERRLAEAARMGFERALVPAGQAVAASGLEVVPVATLEDAFSALGPALRVAAG